MASRTFFLRGVVLVGLAVGGLSLHRSGAQSFTDSDPVGVVTIPLPAQSDTRVSIPFVRPAPYAGTIQSVTGGNVLTVTDAPNWSANQFAYNANTGQHDAFFVLLGKNAGASGPTPKEGCFYTVTANGANTLTLFLNGDDLSAVQPGTRVTLIPYWTLGTAFPAGDAGRSFVASASPSALATTVVPALTKTSFPNSPPQPLYGPPGRPRTPPPPAAYYFCAGAWRHTQRAATVVCDDDLLPPNVHFVVRNTAATALSFRPPGVVLMGKIVVPVPTTGGEDSWLESPVGLPRPVAMSLNASGLIASGAIRPVEQTSGDGSSTDDHDALTVYDHTTTGYNPGPSASYFFSGGAWRQSGDPTGQDFGAAAVLPPGGGLILHKATADGATVFWQNAPNYPAGSNP